MLEYCRGGDLQRFIKSQPGARLTEGCAQHFMRHLAAGLKFLNDRNLVSQNGGVIVHGRALPQVSSKEGGSCSPALPVQVHRDIKPQNLLLTENRPTAVLKIADFGFARHLEGTCMAETLCGSPLYMAPEILSQNQYNAKADLWSVGAVLFEMVAGRPPFAAQSQVELLRVIRLPLKIPSDIDLSHQCVALLQNLLKREPLERISFEDFFLDPFVDMEGGCAGVDGKEDGSLAGPLAVGGEEEQAKQSAGDPTPGAGARTAVDRVSPLEASVAIGGPAPSGLHLGGVHSNTRFMPTGGDRGPTSATARHAEISPSPRKVESHAQVHVGEQESFSASGRGGSSSSSSSALPFHNHHHRSSVPSPRVNPFKPLAASPPGAAALALASGGVGTACRSGQSSSHTGASSGRRACGGSTSTGNPSLSGSSGEGGGGSQESDGFVIIDPPPEARLPSASTSTSAPLGAGSSQPPQQQQPPPPSSGLATSGSGLCGLLTGQSDRGSSQLTKSTDSVEGALRVLTYVESSTRRAVLIASLGDAKAIAGLARRRDRLGAGGLPTRMPGVSGGSSLEEPSGQVGR